MRWIFPAIITTRSIHERVDKIKDETQEFLEAISQEERDKEAVDIYHAVETFLRKQFEGREEVLDEIIKKTFDKNNSRQYYTKQCF